MAVNGVQENIQKSDRGDTMKVGDLVRLRYKVRVKNTNFSIGMIVDESVLENVREITRMYKVLWQDGNSYLYEWTALEVIQ